MKTKFKNWCRNCGGYALLMVTTLIAACLLVAGATISRTYTVAKMNDRNNQYVLSLNAAEAAVEKVYARLSYDFQSSGLGLVTNNLAMYRTNVPSEDPYWSQFLFTDGQGNTNQTYVNYAYAYSGPLPSQYSSPSGALFAQNSPVYRIVSNVTLNNGRATMTNAIQEDVLLALVPITEYAIFYNGLLEFTSCATMTVNGKVHCNTNIYVGSSNPLTFNGTVTSSGRILAISNNGNGPFSFPGNVSFNGTPGYKTNVPTVTVSINMTNTHSLIDIPPSGESPSSSQGLQRTYNQAQIVMLVSNNWVYAKIQQSINGNVPGADPSPTIIQCTNSPGPLSTNFPFLTLTNTFYDLRERKTNIVAQIDIGKYSTWLSSSSNAAVQSKFPTGGGNFPTTLFLADMRSYNSNQLTVVRITNGIAPPSNGGLGFSLATPNPLYVWGNYNQTNAAFLNTTNTTSGTVPSALMSDALTILSPNWKDSGSYFVGNDYHTNDAANTTINAAIITGVVPSIDTSNTGFSGGVHNLPRMLEDWLNVSGGQRTLTLNTSIVSLFQSNMATSLFRNPGNFGLPNTPYYDPPVRQFSFDQNFMNPAKQPPSVPAALVPIRFNWAVPPPNTVTYNVVP